MVMRGARKAAIKTNRARSRVRKSMKGNGRRRRPAKRPAVKPAIIYPSISGKGGKCRCMGGSGRRKSLGLKHTGTKVNAAWDAKFSGKGAGGIFKKVRKPVKFLARVVKENASDPDVKKAATVLGGLASNKKRKQSKGAEAALAEAIVRAGI